MTISVDAVAEMWTTDSKIDRTEIGEEVLRADALHSKYYKLFCVAKQNLRDAEKKLKTLRLNKWEHYTQGPSKESAAWGWKMPHSGRVLKTDVERYLSADPDVQEREEAVAKCKDTVDYLESILRTLAFRNSALRNFIDWEMFLAGVSKRK